MRINVERTIVAANMLRVSGAEITDRRLAASIAALHGTSANVIRALVFCNKFNPLDFNIKGHRLNLLRDLAGSSGSYEERLFTVLSPDPVYQPDNSIEIFRQMIGG